MSRPARYDIAVKVGGSLTDSIEIRGGDGRLIDLTGASAKIEVRHYDGTLITTWSTANGKLTLSGVSGTVTFAVGASDTAGITPGTYLYDLRIVTSISSIVLYPIEGTATFIEGVTA